MHDLADRLTRRVQLTSDGYRVYLEAVESALDLDIDFAMLMKVYGAGQQNEEAVRPGQDLAAKRR